MATQPPRRPAAAAAKASRFLLRRRAFTSLLNRAFLSPFHFNAASAWLGRISRCPLSRPSISRFGLALASSIFITSIHLLSSTDRHHVRSTSAPFSCKRPDDMDVDAAIPFAKPPALSSLFHPLFPHSAAPIERVTKCKHAHHHVTTIRSLSVLCLFIAAARGSCLCI